MAGVKETMSEDVKREILLHINQRLYDDGKITRSIYETAKIKIVNGIVRKSAAIKAKQPMKQ